MIIIIIIIALDYCQDGDIRISGDIDQDGKLEVCVDGIWGTVCSSGWITASAGVVCRQLGYDTDTGWYC